ncbi:MAG: protein kinase domain-containing protein [Pyrinomonadaceae bacterium]
MFSEISTNKITEIFISAFDLAPTERERFLARACAGDDRLRREVESLFAAHDEAGNFLDDVSAVSVVRDSLDRGDEFIGRTIDKYRVIREIGRGGMGIVFLATREDFHQQVALKLIKRGMDSDQILERFRREREILAALNHPFIARLLDGGTTEDGMPFFVMEFVEGVPVDEYCRKNGLSETGRLELFRKVCAAVAFAHQKLIVHRDLKPSNILVNADGEPKLLDFGIAKLLDNSDANETQTNQRVLTPAYASPEQMRGDIVSTASDVYSLGVILKELLTERKTARMLEFKTLKSTDDKAKSENRTNLNSRISNLESRILKGDLRNIIAKSTREEASRRYQSVEAFSEDIRRYLARLPIRARRDSVLYRASKFIRRNRIGVAVAALVLLLLTGGAAATLWQAREARREREIAERRFENLRRISNSLIFEIHGAIEDLPGSLPARQLLLKRAVEQLDALAAESGDNADLQDELAKAYFNLIKLPDTTLAEREATLRKYIAVYQNLLAKDANNIHYREQIALGFIEFGDLTKVRGSINESLEFNKQAISILEQVVKDEPDAAGHRKNLRDAYANAVVSYEMAGDANSVLEISRRELNIAEDLRRMNWDEAKVRRLIYGSHLQTGGGLTMKGDYRAAIDEIKKALDGYETEHAAAAENTLLRYYLWSANRRLAIAYNLNGEANKAFEHSQTALSIIEDLLAESPKDLGYHRNAALTNLLVGQMLCERNQVRKAVAHFRRAAELSEYVISKDAEYGESKMDLARAKSDLGDALFLDGNRQEGLFDLRESARIYAENYDAANYLLKRDYAETCERLGADLAKTRAAESRSWLAESLRIKNTLRPAEISAQLH